jgi:hypothetical protein
MYIVPSPVKIREKRVLASLIVKLVSGSKVSVLYGVSAAKSLRRGHFEVQYIAWYCVDVWRYCYVSSVYNLHCSQYNMSIK